MNKRVRVIVPVALLAAAGLAWAVLRNGNAGGAWLEASGTVEATEADRGFQIPGRVARVGPREGDAVAPGEDLAALDVAELAAARDAAAAQVAVARARLSELERGSREEEVAQADAAAHAAHQREEEASREADRADRLFQGGAVSRRDRDKAATALELAVSAQVQADKPQRSSGRARGQRRSRRSAQSSRRPAQTWSAPSQRWPTGSSPLRSRAG